jgi:hypothetical protein
MFGNFPKGDACFKVELRTTPRKVDQLVLSWGEAHPKPLCPIKAFIVDFLECATVAFRGVSVRKDVRVVRKPYCQDFLAWLVAYVKEL